jgi:hypothetical protein
MVCPSIFRPAVARIETEMLRKFCSSYQADGRGSLERMLKDLYYAITTPLECNNCYSLGKKILFSIENSCHLAVQK